MLKINLQRIIRQLVEININEKFNIRSACELDMIRDNIERLSNVEHDIQQILEKMKIEKFEYQITDNLIALYKKLTYQIWVVEQVQELVWQVFSKTVKNQS